jgi:coenzyme F420-reducing hydrogenase gamma subunit
MKPRIAVHKFASCDGCQLAFLNLGEPLLALAELVDIVHFAEAGPFDPEATVDVAFIEGSITTPDDVDRIRRIRTASHYLVTIGACATAGGLQALRNLADGGAWLAAVYAQPQYIDALATSTPIAAHVKVDFELWGCPVTGRQVLAALRALLDGATPRDETEKVCMECKRRQTVCVLVAKGTPCLGPVTRTGCGAICPRFGRDCYACYGPAENLNIPSLRRRFEGLGLPPDAIDRRFLSFNAAAPAFVGGGRRG